jgi:hypothetical protein
VEGRRVKEFTGGRGGLICGMDSRLQGNSIAGMTILNALMTKVDAGVTSMDAKIPVPPCI